MMNYLPEKKDDTINVSLRMHVGQSQAIY